MTFTDQSVFFIKFACQTVRYEECIIQFEIDINIMNMKKIYTIVALVAMFLAASCGNAGAQNEKKDVNQKKAVTELTVESFNANVYDMSKEEPAYLGKVPAIVDFNATWCGPCQRIAPVLEELAKEYEGKIVVYKVDVDKARDLAVAFGVSSIPAILYIPMDGEPQMTVGARGKEQFRKEIDTILLGK